MNNFTIRQATLNDLEAIAAIELACFPISEACSKSSFEKRIEAYPECFLVGEIEGRIVSIVNGLRTDIKDLMDEMYSDASFHQTSGKWQMVFGVATHPSYQKQGYARLTLNQFIANAKRDELSGVVLTCKDYMIAYYESFGFVDEGVSDSTHGDVIWHQMRLTF